MRAKAEILAEVRDVVARGYREVQLLGQIVNHYQAPDEPGCDFPALLEAVHEVPGLDRIRFASPHPRHMSDRAIEAVRDLPKVCKHLHLPVQSGSTRVLRAMRRRYSREEYLDLVARVRGRYPERSAIDRYDRWLPWRDRQRLRRDVVADRGCAVSQHVLVQVFGATQHAGVAPHAGRYPGRGEDAPHRRAAAVAATDSAGAARSSRSGGRSTCSSIRRAGVATNCPGARVATPWSTFRDHRHGSDGWPQSRFAAPVRTACGANRPGS